METRPQDPAEWARARDLFLDLVELDRAARADALARLAAVDAPLATWVERLLANDPGEETSPGSRRFGPYETTRRIAAGGMGEVYLARRVDGEFEREVAIKLLRCSFRGDEAIRRFQRERQVLAGLDHEYVARLLDGGTTPDGEPYLVMEYVEGLPLDAYCREHDLDLRARLQLFLRVLSAVQHAHERGVVHRDLKPSNILVRGDGTPRLLDFGISRPHDDATPDGPLTRTGHRLFTPEYASPEQVRGDDVAPATDVFALGVVLYELLTGIRPWSVSYTLHQLEQAILFDDPLRPSRQQTGTARRALSGDLDTIVLKCLAKTPTDRYLGALDLAADVDLHLRGYPIRARRAPLASRAWRFVRRRRWPLLGAAGALLALVAAGWTWRVEQERRAERRAAQEVAASLAAQRAELVASLGARIDAAAALRRRGQLAAARAELEATRESAGALDDEPALQARIRGALAVVANHESAWQDALAHLDDADAWLARASDPPAELVASLGNARAYSLFKNGNKAEALVAARAALAHARAHLPPGHELFTDILLELTEQHTARDEHDEALAFLDEATEGLRARGDPRDSGLGQILNSHGAALFQQERYEEALARFREAHDILAFHLGGGDPSLALIARNMADCLRHLGRHDEARAALLPTLERYRDLDRPVDLAESYRALGDLERDSGNLPAALAAFLAGREVFARYSASHPVLAKFDTWTADVRERQGEHLAAIEDYVRALSGRHSIAAYGPALEGAARAGLGRALLALNEDEAGRAELRTALDLLTRAHGADSPQAAAVRVLLDD